ncbi:cbb3-type cytochrome oxidase subunit 3 [Neptuniibacter sp. PT8_73]|uniref:cbb3-type cytochrome oxidase subunit 3 n=1 Tax=unclassified Neptuniibacter TaxID=2630693 RepID=UPI0039F70C46
MSYEVYGPYIPVIMLITFLALFVWVLNPKNKDKYDDAANMPLNEPDEADEMKSDNTEASDGRIEK